jgi:polyisoprenoid-binding protein YceI
MLLCLGFLSCRQRTGRNSYFLIILGDMGKVRKSSAMSAIAVLVLFAGPTLRAQLPQLTLQFAPSTTSINFTLGDLLHTVHGSFALKSGEVQYDPETEAVHGSLVVDATSAQSNNRFRDHRMHHDILESARYPEITFRPDRVEGKVVTPGTATLQVHGIFSIHGADHELIMPVQVQVFANHWIADTHFTVPYVNWGIKNPSSFLLRVSESVEVDVHATGANPPPGVSGH